MPMLVLDVDDNDDIGFVHEIRPIVEGVFRVVEPPELYIVLELFSSPERRPWQFLRA